MAISTRGNPGAIAPPLTAPVRVDIPASLTEAGPVELSIVMPCLNEAQTLEGCVLAARRAIEEGGLAAEIIVADNGSTDGSQEIARRAGARVVDVKSKGYGAALMGGFNAAQGRYLIMGDSDMSYDFGECPKFVAKLREGYDLVMGNRFDTAGGGGIQPGAMPLKNRYVGNPFLSWLGRTLFQCPVHDFLCGLRGFSREALDRMDVRTPGMEFASEIVIRATLRGLRITEVPIKLHKDGRGRPPHLRPWRDGWRYLRFMMCLSPRWALLFPGVVILALGLIIGGIVSFGTVYIGRVGFDVHTLVGASLLVLVGYQWVATGLVMRVFGIASEIGPAPDLVGRFARLITLERGLMLGLGACLLGVLPIAWVLWTWAAAGFGPLDIHTTIRPMVIGATVIALGVQTVLLSVVCAMFRLRRDAMVERGTAA